MTYLATHTGPDGILVRCHALQWQGAADWLHAMLRANQHLDALCGQSLGETFDMRLGEHHYTLEAVP